MAVTVTGDREKTVVREAEATLDITSVRRRGRGGRGGRGGGGGNGKGPNGGGPGGPGGDDRRGHSSPDRYRIGVLVGLASILMMFTALASAYIVRAGLPTSFDWRPMDVPGFVWVSTALLVASSVTFSLARRALRRGEEGAYRAWLTATLLLGLGFLGSQFMAWRQLVARGVYLATNPHSSFFYVLTGLHAVHVVGGLMGLAFLSYYARRGAAGGAQYETKRGALTDAVGLYWHFMDGLWVFLFLLLFFWR